MADNEKSVMKTQIWHWPTFNIRWFIYFSIVAQRERICSSYSTLNTKPKLLRSEIDHVLKHISFYQTNEKVSFRFHISVTESLNFGSI